MKLSLSFYFFIVAGLLILIGFPLIKEGESLPWILGKVSYIIGALIFVLKND